MTVEELKRLRRKATEDSLESLFNDIRKVDLHGRSSTYWYALTDRQVELLVEYGYEVIPPSTDFERYYQIKWNL